VKITYSLGVIHADLSEYNIFASEDGVQLIDWPQYITLEHPHADEILERDVSNILTHFSRKYEIKRELDETIREIKNQAARSAEGEEGEEIRGLSTVEKLDLEEAQEEEAFEEDIFQDEDFEVENFEAEEFEAEEFEAEETEAEETETKDLK
jgi:RIO kinase 2